MHVQTITTQAFQNFVSYVLRKTTTYVSLEWDFLKICSAFYALKLLIKHALLQTRTHFSLYA